MFYGITSRCLTTAIATIATQLVPQLRLCNKFTNHTFLTKVTCMHACMIKLSTPKLATQLAILIQLQLMVRYIPYNYLQVIAIVLKVYSYITQNYHIAIAIYRTLSPQCLYDTKEYSQKCKSQYFVRNLSGNCCAQITLYQQTKLYIYTFSLLQLTQIMHLIMHAHNVKLYFNFNHMHAMYILMWLQLAIKAPAPLK